MAHPTTTVKRVLLAGTVTIALAGLGRPAFAYDDGYQNVFTSVLTSVGVLPQERSPEIDYRERPPLVLPPNTAQLAKPVSPSRPAAWPTDPDRVRRKKEAEEVRTPIALFEKNDRPIPKDELMRYRAAQTEDVAPSGCNAFEKSMAKCRSDPAELKAEEQRFKATNPDKSESAVAGVEPDRTYLTQPPKGYLKATKTVKATAEAPVKRHDESSPLSTYIHPVDNKSVDPLDH